jgi:predicted dehydrogenase
LTGRGIDTADLYVTQLEFEDGAMAVIENTWILPQSAPALVDHRAEIIGTDGVVHLDPHYSGTIAKYTEHTPAGFPQVSLPDMFVGPRVQGKSVGFAPRSIDHFVECIRDGKTPVTSGEDGLMNTRIILAAEASAARGGVPVVI